jgi:hypothetical protein
MVAKRTAWLAQDASNVFVLPNAPAMTDSDGAVRLDGHYAECLACQDSILHSPTMPHTTYDSSAFRNMAVSSGQGIKVETGNWYGTA